MQRNFGKNRDWGTRLGMLQKEAVSHAVVEKVDRLMVANLAARLAVRKFLPVIAGLKLSGSSSANSCTLQPAAGCSRNGPSANLTPRTQILTL
jgi:hypothetical protein